MRNYGRYPGIYLLLAILFAPRSKLIYPSDCLTYAQSWESISGNGKKKSSPFIPIFWKPKALWYVKKLITLIYTFGKVFFMYCWYFFFKRSSFNRVVSKLVEEWLVCNHYNFCTYLKLFFNIKLFKCTHKVYNKKVQLAFLQTQKSFCFEYIVM